MVTDNNFQCSMIPPLSNPFHRTCFKDTHREKSPSDKTPALRKSTKMVVWAVATLNELFIRGS